MLIQFGQAFSNYFYDIFIAKFDFWLVFGLAAQLAFAARFLVQWIASERAGKSVVPLAFWFFSIGGGLMTLIYGLVKREPVIIFGQLLSNVIYVRNVMLIFKNRQRESQTLSN
ncbi:membrane protein [Bradyrhizobium sp. SSBR45G]|uniref:lipid-A-disaccharide synthase N-terminal domain-containing protein n=1 Tax=unclassified Bradyrhizobium TaxID=2631580 RepID=UPI0023429BCF|nr:MULTISPECIES: lipid-A-disaccharide synthase N-terminal domain-containing protein [unclassified Bradyrhizobium]GLH75591.1 membrane protein [Bradyrhizobium sp. SSBR45G]GLH82619.1 membrane protein [Bradyrhizobium sp. SSBR45R]